MLRFNLCDFRDAYIVVKGRISVTGINDANRINKKLTFKNNAPFGSCISKINNTFVDSAEDLDIVILVCNLLEYNNNYSMTGRFWNYYGDEVNDSANGIYDNDGKINNNKTTIGKSSEYKIKVIGSTLNNNNTLAAEVAVPLKYLSKFWRSLNLSLIKCEIEVDLRWTKNCVIPEISRTFRAVGDTLEQEVATSTTGATF